MACIDGYFLPLSCPRQSTFSQDASYMNSGQPSFSLMRELVLTSVATPLCFLGAVSRPPLRCGSWLERVLVLSIHMSKPTEGHIVSASMEAIALETRVLYIMIKEGIKTMALFSKIISYQVDQDRSTRVVMWVWMKSRGQRRVQAIYVWTWTGKYQRRAVFTMMMVG